MPQKEKIQEMFDSVAPSYDRLNHIMSLGVDRIWRRKAMREIVDGSQQRILDVACGTGDSTIAIAKSAGSGTRVTGVDISDGMMSLVMEKACHEGVHDRIKLLKADAEALPFQDGSFHRVFCAFGIRNFEHKDIALQEFLRVLATGGKAVILELSVPDNRRLRRLYDVYFMHILPFIGGLISGNRQAYKYLPASVHAFPAPPVFCDMMRTAGFTDVSFRTFTLGLCRLYIGTR